jgi:sporulation protein YlmC with PRC-barrel domain
MKGLPSQSRNEGLVHWGYLESTYVYTTDKRMVGLMRGIMIDPANWVVSQIVVEVDEDILRQLNIEKPLSKAALVNVPTSLVKGVSDIVQLDADLDSLRGVVSVYNERLVGRAHATKM